MTTRTTHTTAASEIPEEATLVRLLGKGTHFRRIAKIVRHDDGSMTILAFTKSTAVHSSWVKGSRLIDWKF